MSHCGTPSLYDHLDHCFVVFTQIQQSFLTRRTDVWGHEIKIVEIINLSMNLIFVSELCEVLNELQFCFLMSLPLFCSATSVPCVSRTAALSYWLKRLGGLNLFWCLPDNFSARPTRLLAGPVGSFIVFALANCVCSWVWSSQWSNSLLQYVPKTVFKCICQNKHLTVLSHVFSASMSLPTNEIVRNLHRSSLSVFCWLWSEIPKGRKCPRTHLPCILLLFGVMFTLGGSSVSFGAKLKPACWVSCFDVLRKVRKCQLLFHVNFTTIGITDAIPKLAPSSINSFGLFVLLGSTAGLLEDEKHSPVMFPDKQDDGQSEPRVRWPLPLQCEVPLDPCLSCAHLTRHSRQPFGACWVVQPCNLFTTMLLGVWGLISFSLWGYNTRILHFAWRNVLLVTTSASSWIEKTHFLPKLDCHVATAKLQEPLYVGFNFCTALGSMFLIRRWPHIRVNHSIDWWLCNLFRPCSSISCDSSEMALVLSCFSQKSDHVNFLSTMFINLWLLFERVSHWTKRVSENHAITCLSWASLSVWRMSEEQQTTAPNKRSPPWMKTH